MSGSHLVRDARIVPLLPGESVSPEPVDVLVEDGRVTQVVLGLAAEPGVPELRAEGRWLVPGLWDQHTHLGQWTLTAQRLDLAPTRTPEEVLRAVAARVAERPGEPLVGWGHRAGGWGREVTVAELDAVTGGVAAVLISGDGHHAWLNSRALAALGLAPRDSLVEEVEWFAAYPRLSTLVGDQGTSPAAYRAMLEQAAALGVVGLVDFEFGARTSDWVERWQQGADLLRIRAAVYAERLDDVLAAGLATGDPLLPLLPGAGDLLTMGPLKIISDGSLNTRTAWCCDPYTGGGSATANYGAANLDAADLVDLLARARAARLEVATHAIGDAALDQALSAYARTGAGGSIEHAQLVRRDDVRRMAELGLRASMQPAHLLDDRDPTERLWADRADRCFTFRWMLEDGVTLALGSDAPVSPLDPWLAIAAAVHRSADERGPWHPEQALAAQEALAASVDGQPSVQVGSRGDLVLLDRDPLAAPGADPDDTAGVGTWLREMTVGATLVAGRLVHSTLT